MATHHLVVLLVLRKVFLKFMKEHNALARYLVEIDRQGGNDWKLFFDPRTDGEFMEPENAISNAFSWELSQQGKSYWEVLNVKWNTKVVAYTAPASVCLN